MSEVVTVASPTAINVETVLIKKREIEHLKQELLNAQNYLVEFDTGVISAKQRQRIVDNIARLQFYVNEAIRLGLDV